MPIMTNWMASVYNGESFINTTDMIVIKQVSGGVTSAQVHTSTPFHTSLQSTPVHT